MDIRSLSWMLLTTSVLVKALFLEPQFSKQSSTVAALALFQKQRIQQTGGVNRDAALAIVPPDKVWDKLQRARHYARDDSYDKWPPCLRLLHPFGDCRSRSDLDDLALCVARVVDKYQIQPFDIRLTEWSVIPHAEAMESDWRAMQTHHSSIEEKTSRETLMTDQDRKVQRLIADEERKGKEKKLKERQQRSGQASASVTKEMKEQAASDGRKALWEKHKQMYEEFNGPCVVCLEPDEESRHNISVLRELLLAEPELSKFTSYGPTLTLSDRFPFSTSTHTLEYRPIIPIASFPTVTSAVEMARKLRALWEPLSIRVTDLHVVSIGMDPRGCRQQEGYALGSSLYSWAQSPIRNENERQIGCDALVMLAGEELVMDNSFNERMANMVAKQGYSGGCGRQEKRHDANLLPSEKDETTAIHDWLDELEDEEDEGTVVVIGRTHFFTGEMREYMGMPATSAVGAAKDRSLRGMSSSGAKRGSGPVRPSRSKNGDGRKTRRKEEDSHKSSTLL